MTKKIEKQYVHGNHWNAVLESNEDLINLIPKLINTNSKNHIVKVASPFIGMIEKNPPIRYCILLKSEPENNQTLLHTSYPFLQINNPIKLKISNIEEWPGGVEAVITGATSNGIELNFFDTLYFLNKEKYKKGKNYVFNIAALAYSYTKRAKELEIIIPTGGPLKGKKLSTHGTTGYQCGSVYTDDFSFMNPFHGFSKIHGLENHKYCEFAFYLKSSEEDAPPLYFPIFIKTDVLDKYKPKPNDDIDGTGWLTGYLDGSLES